MSTNLVPKTPLPFEIPTLAEHLNSNDHLALIIRAHLYVEAILIRHIETVVVNKQEFDSAKLQFAAKLKLAVALGKVDQADSGALKTLNKLRNDFAHDLTTQLQEQDELDLYNTFSKRQRTFAEHLGRTPQMVYIGRLRADLMALISATNEGPNNDNNA